MPADHTCPTPHKIRFDTKGMAKVYKQVHAAYFATIGHKIYIYHCSCGAHHFTKSLRKDYPKPAALPDLRYGEAFKRFLRS